MQQTTIIKPTSGWQLIDVKAIWAYRDLLYFLSLRGIKIKYAQSILGVGWAVFDPLIQAIIFTVIFGNLAKLGSDGTPYILFSYTAMVSWTYFSGILTEATGSLVKNRTMIGKVYFPRLILPLSAVFGKLIDFGVASLVLIGLLIYYGMTPSATIIMVPVLLLILILTSIGAGCFLAALAVQYRDIQYAMSFLVRVLMYSAPVVYSVSIIPERWQPLYALNPMVGVIEGMRSIFLQNRPFPWEWVGTGFATSLVIFLIGCFYFRRTERHFADLA
ncbi:ABC transporter permease [Neolewinella antarctica]|uniref:Transport permease protein n=1 Tax=Neolewinella antarctica TaxID=442734 RepID=A0ABX0XA62_9BACT|nr:ABC transporter permease [Neolewinella antarctica]NJC26138.1 lipopolysaccharide transport system permease protein [Neolewinella antarctica]